MSESSYGILFPRVLIWIHTFSHIKAKPYYSLYTIDCDSNLFWKEQGKVLKVWTQWTGFRIIWWPEQGAYVGLWNFKWKIRKIYCEHLKKEENKLARIFHNSYHDGNLASSVIVRYIKKPSGFFNLIFFFERRKGLDYRDINSRIVFMFRSYFIAQAAKAGTFSAC